MSFCERHHKSEPRGHVPVFPSLILSATAVCVIACAVTVCLWRTTGDTHWLSRFFYYPGALFLVGASAVELALCLQCLRAFSPGEHMGSAWLLLLASAVCHFTGSVMSELFGVRSWLNPLVFWHSERSTAVFASMRVLGLTLGGPVRWLFLAWGLCLVLRVYRQMGLLGRIRHTDWFLIMVTTIYVFLEAGAVVAALRTGTVFSLYQQINWLNDPLLLVLMIEAILIYRSLVTSGFGRVSKCWGTYVLAIVFTCLGDIGLLAHAYGYAPWPAEPITWHTWLIASGLFALAPAYQLLAIRRIHLSLQAITRRRTLPLSIVPRENHPWRDSFAS
jgi:hypothetical protein